MKKMDKIINKDVKHFLTISRLSLKIKFHIVPLIPAWKQNRWESFKKRKTTNIIHLYCSCVIAYNPPVIC